MDLPSLTALRAFEAAVRHGSLSGAGRELNVTHAAVAQQVRRLEDWLDAKLLVRAGRGVAPTGPGAQLAQALRDGFELMQAGVERVTEDRARRALRITCTPSFAVAWLMQRLGAFRALHPETELMVNPTAQSIDLVAEDYDVAFRYGGGDWPGLEATRLVASDIVVVAAPALVARHKITKPGDLGLVPWVQELGTDEVQTWLASQGVVNCEIRNVLNVPGSFAMEAIRTGQGVGLAARVTVAADIAAGRMVTLFEAATDPALGYYLVHRPGPHRPALKAFLSWVRRELVEDPA